MMKRFATLSLAVVLACLVACTTAPASKRGATAQRYQAGVYTASAVGMRGPVKVQVEFSDSAITAIKVLEHHETIRVGESAVKLLPGMIVDSQSLAVDSISSATYTSGAIKAAVADCVKQAGGDVAALKKAPVARAKPVEETLTFDVVVVGGGISGLASATAAANRGASVALLEKEPFLGGTSVMSEGYMFSVGTDTKEGLYNLFLSRAAEAPSPQFPDKDMLHVLADNSTPTQDMLKEAGTEIVVLRAFTSIAVPEAGGTLAVTRTGYRYIDNLTARLAAKGGKVFCSTPATSLLTDSSGAVVGVVADTPRGRKTFKAKAVILACGDFARNREMMKKYVPQSASCYTISAVGNTGDGITMALKVGARLYEDQYVQGGPLIFDPNDIYRGSYSNPEFLPTSLLVSLTGERRVGEDQGTRPVHYAYTNGDKPDGAWSIMDATVAAGLPNLDTYLERTSAKSAIQAYRADSVAELAGKIGISPDALTRTVDRYNENCRNGKDADFGKASKFLKPLVTGPFYAIRGYAINRGTLGGIYTSTRAEVLDENKKPIPGLYAAGTISSRAFFSKTYHGGSALGLSSTMGYVAGNNAAALAGK